MYEGGREAAGIKPAAYGYNIVINNFSG